jgi:DNA invertase Pin-like site-specific DNA recombinase
MDVRLKGYASQSGTDSGGITAAHQRGVKFGRKLMERPADFKTVRELWKQVVFSSSEAARRLGINRPHLYAVDWEIIS